MWGQELQCRFCVVVLGIIPMRVGTSVLQYLLHLLDEDHPHACGDKYSISSIFRITEGSSPCVWGQVSFVHKAQRLYRIIPMRVGTSSAVDCSNQPSGDHPHACGDKISFLFLDTSGLGSSPCVWGQGPHLPNHDYLKRIIPMRVGTSQRSNLLIPL